MRGFSQMLNVCVARPAHVVACVLSFTIGITDLVSSAQAATPSGTVIRNIAQTTYFNPNLGITERVYSNPVEAIVAEVPALEINGYSDLVLSRGAMGQYYFEISNTGNMPLEASIGIEDLENAGYVQGGQLALDLNRNGLIDNGDRILSNSDVVSLSPDESFQIIYEFQVSELAVPDMVLTSALTLTATTLGGDVIVPTGTSEGISTLATGALELEKSQTIATQNDADVITYTLRLRNNSDDAVTGYDTINGTALRVDGTQVVGILLADDIPLNTVFAEVVDAGGMQPVYHLRGTPAHDYSTVAPAESYDIDSVAFFHAGDYPSGRSSDPSFAVASPLILGAVEIENTGQVNLSDARSVLSNMVTYARAGEIAASLRFVDPTSGDDTVYGQPDSDTALSLAAGACNISVDIDQIDITLRSVRTGDIETVTAYETGANTGIFITAGVPLTVMGVAVSGDGVMATSNGDRIMATSDCGTGTLDDMLWINPGNFLFNSVTNAPVSGATIVLIDAATGAEVDRSDTDAQGFFSFDTVDAGTYLYVVEDAPAWVYPSVRLDFPGYGRIVTDAGYANAFSHEGGVLAMSDIPVDPFYGVPLSLEKSVDRDTVGFGEFVSYTIDITNNMYQALIYAQVLDRPSRGATFIAGSVTLDGQPIADPIRDAQGDLVFELGTLLPLTSYDLSYVVQFTAAATEGRNENTALLSGSQAGTGTYRASSVARAVVDLNNSGGVFAREGIVIGSVFMDCNANGMRDADDDHAEPGIPGVRIVTQQGLSVVTDRDGKYSLNGLRPVTHAFLVQPETLPRGTSVSVTRTNDLMRGGSRLIPLKRGEMRAEHFAVETCSSEAMDEVKARQAWFDENHQPEALTASDLPIQGARAATRSSRTQAGVATTTQLTPDMLDKATKATQAKSLGAKAAQAQAMRPLPALMASLDNTAGFIGLESGQELTRSTTKVRLKANMDLSVSLLLNGREVSETQLGERSTLEKKNLQALEYVAVKLRAGVNTLTLIGKDPFGIERERVEITVMAAGDPARLDVIVPELASADPTAIVPVVVRILDVRGRPVPASAVITLSAKRGLWDVDDIRPATPGIQAYIDNGEATFDLIPPQVSGPDTITVISGFDRAEARMIFTPNLDERILIGVIEGAIALGGGAQGPVLPAGQFSSFEDTTTGLNGEIYLKGAIRGDALLTLRYSGDRDTEDRLFRDIRGDEYYPVYGDNSERGFDAQSSSNLYVKVEKGRSYVLYGDIAVEPEASAFELGGLRRVATGAKAHWEDDRTSVTVFAAQISAQQAVAELSGRGVSGPYDIDLSDYIDGSDRVEILIRDAQGGDILSSTPLLRGTDYSLDFFRDTITFDTPVRQFDADGNPVSIRVTYEVRAAGADKYWLYGAEVNHQLTDRTMVGARLVNADAAKGTKARSRLVSAYVTHAARNGGIWGAEMARSEDATGTQDDAARLSYGYEDETHRVDATAIYTGTNFVAGGGLAQAGTTQVRLSYGRKLDHKSALAINAEYVADRVAEAERITLEVLYSRQLSQTLHGEVGVELSRRTTGDTSTVDTALVLGARWQPKDRDNTTVKADLRVPVSGRDETKLTIGLHSEPKKGWRVYHEAELSFGEGMTTTHFNLGFDYALNDWLEGHFKLSQGAGDDSTLLNQGLTATWRKTDNITYTFDLEHARALEVGEHKLTSVALGAKWQNLDESWVGDADLETTFEPRGETYYANLGLAGKISEDLSVLGRVRAAYDTRDGADIQRLRSRIGLAYRPLDDPRLEVLAWYENRIEQKHGRSVTHLWSVDASYEADSNLRLNGKYAGQHQSYTSEIGTGGDGLTQLIQAGALYEFGDDRFQIGANAAYLWDDAGNSARGLGAEIGFVPTKGTQIGLGYHHSTGQVKGQSALYQDGFYLRLNLLLDNSLWGKLDGFLGN
ncbi:MAG: putative repeat protein (TIGR01451 family) [Celeribacter sp.]|jgi:uncharacterized repeat protein (TIGR01451 family)